MFELDNEVTIDNIKNIPLILLSNYKKYLKQVGKIKMIDSITVSDKAIYMVSFENDELLHSDFYSKCNVEKTIVCKPLTVKFFEENLKLIN